VKWWKGLLGIESDRLEQKQIIGLNDALAGAYGASRQDGINFRTNMVTLAEYQDSGAGSAGTVLALSTAFACVRLISGTISSLPLMVYREGSDGREVAKDHPLYRILHDSPNADQTALNFWQFVSASIELQGNGFAEVFRAGNGRVTSLGVPFAPDFVKVKRLANGSLSYTVDTGGGPRTLRQDQVLHIRGFGGNPLGGLSTLTYGRHTFGLAGGLERAASSTFKNGVSSNVAFMSERVLDAAQMKLATDIIESKYQGAVNQGRPLVVNADMKVQPLSINPQDAQMLESRGFSVEEICRFFSVPPHMIGHTSKATSWGTGIEQMTLGFVQYTLRERLKNIESTLEKQLLTEAERQAGMRIEFNIEGLLRGDSKTRADVHASALLNGWRTINEVRAIENLGPVPGGDVPRMQMQNVPITEAGASEPPAPGDNQ
jgi:HK97 family phage portal protein